MAGTIAARTAATTLASKRPSRRFFARGIHARSQWGHEFVQGQLVGVLINKRKRYDSELRRVLADNQSLHDKADYRAELVTGVPVAGEQ